MKKQYGCKINSRIISMILSVLAVAVFLSGSAPKHQTIRYTLLEESVLQTDVEKLSGKEKGPVIYVVAGIHGNEQAGWMAAERLKFVDLKGGTLFILSQANRFGVKEKLRQTKENRNLNRNFPGDPDGCDAEQIAAVIFADIADKKPDLVLDLHEALPDTGDKDQLGNSLICESLDQDGELILEMLTWSQNEDSGIVPLVLYGSPPEGSINREVTRRLNIPVITVETCRMEKLEKRVRTQEEIVRFILNYYGLTDS